MIDLVYVSVIENVYYFSAGVKCYSIYVSLFIFLCRLFQEFVGVFCHHIRIGFLLLFVMIFCISGNVDLTVLMLRLVVKCCLIALIPEK